jgi:hypothetical protein
VPAKIDRHPIGLLVLKGRHNAFTGIHGRWSSTPRALKTGISGYPITVCGATAGCRGAMIDGSSGRRVQPWPQCANGSPIGRVKTLAT